MVSMTLNSSRSVSCKRDLVYILPILKICTKSIVPKMESARENPRADGINPRPYSTVHVPLVHCIPHASPLPRVTVSPVEYIWVWKCPSFHWRNDPASTVYETFAQNRP